MGLAKSVVGDWPGGAAAPLNAKCEEQLRLCQEQVLNPA